MCKTPTPASPPLVDIQLEAERKAAIRKRVKTRILKRLIKRWSKRIIKYVCMKYLLFLLKELVM